jgi:NAD(P)H-flavin reductase/hemoglobin-like flavoprotein
MFEARQIMTTTSAGQGTAAGDGGGSGEWSWFAPSRKTQPTDTAPGEHGQDRDESEIPRRPVTPIRPIGSSRDRASGAPEPQAQAATPVQAPPAPDLAEPAVDHRPSAPAFGLEPEPEHESAAFGATGGATGAAAADAARPGAWTDEWTPLTSPHSPDAVVVRRVIDEIEPVSDSVTAYFYAMLFVQYPQLRDLFPASMDSQRDRLFRALVTAMKLIDDMDVLTRYLTELGRGHRKYGTQPDHYPAVGECLIAAVSQYAQRSWDEAAEAAWVRAYTTISQIMIDSAAEDEKRAPAWWDAEIVSHEMRTPQIAVLTLRPDQPYPFRAGQHTSVETPWWPRVWRHYSFASAPRSDGLLTLHVKSVPAGWVSSALVNRARQGDVVRLGPPSGAMTVDHGRDSGLVCLGGGTGIAPIKALVEDVAEHGRPRPVEVFYGARSDHDLYELETMLGLAQRHPWLSVRPVAEVGPGALPVVGGPDGGPLEGRLTDVVRQFGPWSSYDGYLSGPPGMIRSGVDALVNSGVPAHRIRHDSLEELAAAAE